MKKQVCRVCKRQGFLGRAYPRGGGYYCSSACKERGTRSRNARKKFGPKRTKNLALLSPKGYVYFIEGQGLVKIGSALNPPKRLQELQTGSPVRLKLIGFYPGGKERERVLHNQFSSCRIHGEWFNALRDRDLMEEVAKARGYANGITMAMDEAALTPGA